MKINGNAVRTGNILEIDKKLWVVAKTSHTQPGKGGAYMQVELKALLEPTKTNLRFRASEQVERVHLEERPYQYLYEEGEQIVLMNPDTYEQIQLDKTVVGDNLAYLQDNMKLNISFYEDKPISVALPLQVTFEVSEADAVVKGQTASSSYKPATLENGMNVKVPPHIEAGMRIVISTEDGSYVERAKD